MMDRWHLQRNLDSYKGGVNTDFAVSGERLEQLWNLYNSQQAKERKVEKLGRSRNRYSFIQKNIQ